MHGTKGRIGGLGVAAARKGISGILARITDRLARARQPKLRRDYEREVRNLVKVERHMRKEGHDVETIARELSKQRRALGVKYKDMTPPDKLEKIFERNIQKKDDRGTGFRRHDNQRHDQIFV